VITPELLDALAELAGLVVRRGEPMARHVPLRMGGDVDLWVRVDSPLLLPTVLRLAKTHHVSSRVHWPFEDWLVRDTGVPGMIVRPGTGFEGVAVTEAGVRIGAAAAWSQLGAVGAPDAWWRFLRSWSGTPGGLFARGDQGRLSRLACSVRVLSGARVRTLAHTPGEPLPDLPGRSVLLDVELSCPERRHSLPRPPQRAGTVFRAVRGRPGTAGLLKRVGAPGTRLRGWRFSDVEPGTITHRGPGTHAELDSLIRAIRTRVERTRGVTLRTAPPLVPARRAPALAGALRTAPSSPSPLSTSPLSTAPLSPPPRDPDDHDS